MLSQKNNISKCSIKGLLYLHESLDHEWTLLLYAPACSDSYHDGKSTRYASGSLTERVRHWSPKNHILHFCILRGW